MNSLIVIGDGGHAKVVIDILFSQNQYKIVGCTSSNLDTKNVMGVAVIGDDSVLPELYKQGVHHAFVAIGDNKKRKHLTDEVSGYGYHIVNVISPKSHISSSIKLGKGIVIMPGAIINADTIVGDNVIVNTGATIDHDCLIEANVHVAPGCHLAGNVTVGDGAFLGVGCQVIPKIKIGEWSVVGAGAVVIKNIPPGVTAFGIPARERQLNQS
jgi:UDP-perosamine 4-acetyltransferase